MNLNIKINKLKSEGLSSNLLTTLTESQITSLYNRLLESKKKEQKEATTTVSKKTTMPKSEFETMMSQGKIVQGNVSFDKNKNEYVVTNEGEMNEDEDAEFNAMTTGVDQDKIQKPGSDYPGSDRYKDTLDEKFESKAQQGLFWARCNKCKTEDCKWCKMAKEFSKSTSKKQYKNMPEKKHPEKTVKYKKKETKEGYLENVGKKVTDTYAKKFASFTPGLAWGGMKENYDKIIEKYTEPTMKKRELLKLIENQIRNKKSLNEDFYFGEELEEDFDMMSMTDERPDFDIDDDYEEEDMPKPISRRMNSPFAPAIEPGIKPSIKPSKPEREPEWEPEEDEPFVPSPDVSPEPQARKNKFMRKFKDDFESKMRRMDESYHKPVNYKKY